MNNDGASALIGYTGFVGSNLLRQRAFDATFNSKNIEQISGRSLRPRGRRGRARGEMDRER